MRMDAFGLEAGLAGELPQDQKSAYTCEAAPFRVQEELGTVPRVEKGAAAREIAPQRRHGLPSDRDDPLLRSFADAAHESSLEIHAGLVESDRLADTQPGAVEELDECAVAQRSRRG